MDTVGNCLHWAAEALFGHSDSPRLDAELLLCAVLGASRAGLIVRSAEILARERRHSFAQLIARRRRGAPVAYLTGTREFWSLPLRVTPAVLVPRPETELLVELALELLPLHQQRSVLDLGTGSGAIALAIAGERHRARVTAVDVSPLALEVAKHNAAILDVSQIAWRVGSWFDAVPGERFDIIVANPPYIADGDPALEQLASEPVLALVAGPTGFEALAAIVREAAAHLNESGVLILEHGAEQSTRVAAMLEHRGFTGIRSRIDYSGVPRLTSATVCSNH